MTQSRTKQIVGSMLGCLAAPALVLSGFWIKAEGQSTKQSQAAAPAEQVIIAIRTATVAKPGNVRAVEVENEAGRTICEVAIVAEDGKSYEVEVDVATDTVVEIEGDDDNEGTDKN